MAVLVTYASRHGATSGIAEKIGEVLRAAGLEAEIKPVSEVDDLTSYDAVILGSAVYAGSWMKEAAAFQEANVMALAMRPVWLFSSGPTGEGEASAIMKGWRFPVNLQPLADRIEPRDIAFFHGVLDLKTLNFGERLIIRGIGAPLGDFRDWELITAWAEDIAAELIPA